MPEESSQQKIHDNDGDNTTSSQESPKTNTAQNPESVVGTSSSKKTKKRKSFRKILSITLFIITLTLLVVFTLSVAYEKITLSKYPVIQKNISHFVQSIPFMPKTPRFLLEKTAITHQNITSQAFDASLAVDSSSFLSDLGMGTFDLSVKGAIDYTNPKEILFDSNISITQQLNLDLRKNKSQLFFRINKFPETIFSLIGYNMDTSGVVGQWVSYDLSSMDTDARKELEEKSSKALSENTITKYVENFVDDKILESLTTEKVNDDGLAVYKLTLTANKDMIDHIGDILMREYRKSQDTDLLESLASSRFNLSEYLADLEIKIFIDRASYFTRKITTSATVKTRSSPTNPSLMSVSGILPISDSPDMRFASSIKFDKFGEKVSVDAPEDAIGVGEFYKRLTDLTEAGGLIDPGSQLRSTRDAQRMSDIVTIQRAVMLYKTDCGAYPNMLSNEPQTSKKCNNSLVPQYLATIPTDPEDESGYYYQVIDSDYHLCAKLENPYEGGTPCPDISFNYHAAP